MIDYQQILAGLALAVLLPLLVNSLTGNGLVKSIPVVNINRYSPLQLPTKFRYVFSGRDMLFGAMKKLDSIFQVVSPLGNTIILPGRYTDDIRNNKKCSFNGFFLRTFFPHVPGFESNAISLKSPVLKDTVRTKLTQSLGPVSLDLCRCANEEVDTCLGTSDEWQRCDIRKHVQELVAKLSTQVFVGERLRRNPEWIRITTDFTIDMMMAVSELRLVPAVLQPLLHWVLPNCYRLRQDRTSARKIIDAEIRTRQQELDDAAAKGLPVSKKSDSIGWVLELARGAPIDVSGIQLSLTFAAIHTTSDMVGKTLYYLAADPDLRKALREEIVEVITTQGWRKTSLTNLKLLDSTLKEVQRLHAASCISMPRWTETELTLHDGVRIPANKMIMILQDKHLDPAVYDNPEEFDPYRYLKLIEKTGDKNHWLFVSTSPDHIGFGHGVHACPGRFFAANEIKIIVIFFLMRYEWRVDGLEQRLKEGKSPVKYFGDGCVLDRSVRIEYKRRTPEIDLMEYAVPVQD